MSEGSVIERTEGLPLTLTTLTHQLRRLGLQPGRTVLVHSSLSRMGWICGGPVTVIEALQNVVETSGTLMMPTHSSDLSEPSVWKNPPVPESWWKVIRKEMPPFRPEWTPTREMGAIPECFRRLPGVLRSPHPQYSFAAWGRRANDLVSAHGLDFGLGEDSPLARLYDVDGDVLLLGVGHDRNTTLHLAEHRAEFPSKKSVQEGAPILVEGERVWLEFEDLDLSEEDFMSIGDAFESEARSFKQGKIGEATARLFSAKEIVDFAVRWMEEHRA